MSAHHLPYLCRHMLWCEEVGQLESGHWHLTAVVSSTAVRAHRWLLLNILHMRVFVWTRGRTCSISRDILSQCRDWWCPHGLGTLIYEVTGLTLLFLIFSFFELGTHFTFPVNRCCVHTVATCELHHKGLTGRGKLELIILLNLTVFVKCINISNMSTRLQNSIRRGQHSLVAIHLLICVHEHSKRSFSNVRGQWTVLTKAETVH